jgi:hypothetical protein
MCLLAPTVALAQDNPNPLSTFNRTVYGAVKNILLHSAEKMPEENYNLTANNMHDLEHYGNLVTYMRLKNVVPPTSEPGFQPMAPPRK